MTDAEQRENSIKVLAPGSQRSSDEERRKRGGEREGERERGRDEGRGVERETRRWQ